jgi:CSLREA domain-containing protein
MFLCTLLAPDAARAITVVVNNAADTFDQLNDCTVSCTLREALQFAAYYGKITFDPAILPAVITLENGALVPKLVTIEGPGASLLTIDAHLSDRIFRVPQNAGSVTISGMSLINGRIVGAAGSDGSAGTAESGGAGADALGGCILVEQLPPSAGPSLKLSGVTLRNCTAQGGAGGRGGSGIVTTTKSGGTGGPGGAGGVGAGGAIYAGFQSELQLEQTSIVDAHAIGGAGGLGGNGGVGAPFLGSGGSGGKGGEGRGGAIYSLLVKRVYATNVTVASADARGGKGGNGGSGDPNFDLVHGGNGGTGGDAHGGLYANYGGSLGVFKFATLGEGVVTAGLRGSGGRGGTPGISGQDGSASAAAIQVVIPNPNDQGLYPTYLFNSAVFSASSANLCEGWTDADLFAFASDNSCTGAAVAVFDGWFKPLTLEADMPSYPPRFGSPGIDAVQCGDVASDQQDTPRPQGPSCDIGAIEADYIFVGEFD